MVAQHTMTRNELLITEVDFHRLKHLVDLPRYRATHPMLALKEGLKRCRVAEPRRAPRGCRDVALEGGRAGRGRGRGAYRGRSGCLTRCHSSSSSAPSCPAPRRRSHLS